jgi:hypothetical protein
MVKASSQMKSPADSVTVFYPPNSVVKTAQGVWYVHRDGRWQPMTQEEVDALVKLQGNEK